MRHNHWFGLISVCLLAWMLPGCATRDSGYKISGETVAFIQPGTTTRADVTDNLGPPLLDLPDLRVSAYSWGKMRVTAGKPAVRTDRVDERNMGYTGASSPWEEPGLVESRRWAYAIAWDDSDRVQRAERIEVEGVTTLERAVREWAGTVPAQ